MDLCWIIFLFSDLITKEALILLHNDDHRIFEMEVAPNNRNILANLTEDVVLEILCRLPVRSLLCCKCVCRSWNHLISNNYKVLPRTLAGFFYNINQGHRHYTSITGEHPSLSFLPFTLDNVAGLRYLQRPHPMLVPRG
jgi:hypothetical protein